MKIPTSEHCKQNWIVHSLLPEFKVEDVWKLPVELQKGHRVSDLQIAFSRALERIGDKGLPGKLFKLRIFLGRIFGWDEKKDHRTFITGSIRERYAKSNKLSIEDLPDPGDGDFVPVYQLENETLSEIENATVHAAIHLSKVQVSEKTFSVHMAIYVNAKGLFGRFYMLLIKPFRLMIIYPAMLRAIEKSWLKHLQEVKM